MYCVHISPFEAVSTLTTPLLSFIGLSEKRIYRETGICFILTVWCLKEDLREMSVPYRKARVKETAFPRLVFLIAVLGVILLWILLKTNAIADLISIYSSSHTDHETVQVMHYEYTLDFKNLKLPKQNELSFSLQKLNQLPPRNLDLYPNLAKDHIVIVLYVHNRPQYLQVAVNSLSQVSGINETLLVVSHDGFFEEMNKIIESIKFCQVKQIFAPYSPHVFPNTFPGFTPSDCKDHDNPAAVKCRGTPDQYGSHRSPKIVSLKHHWWWMMNTVWDGLKETKGQKGHILFIEEDHFIYPNAYQNLKLLIKLKHEKCPLCYAANLAPCDVKSTGEGWHFLVAERMGNVGYSFNRTVWRKIHKRAREFCLFDDYNWDITMWSAVYPSFGGKVYTLRGPRTSAVHFGKCGLHQGKEKGEACLDNGVFELNKVEKIDTVLNIMSKWKVFVDKYQEGYGAGFRGWGGWGDVRDRQLCLDFANMYWASEGGGVRSMKFS